MDRDVVTIQELAALYPFWSQKVWWERIRNGQVPGFKVGRRVFVRLSEIDRTLSSGQADATQ